MINDTGKATTKTEPRWRFPFKLRRSFDESKKNIKIAVGKDGGNLLSKFAMTDYFRKKELERLFSKDDIGKEFRAKKDKKKWFNWKRFSNKNDVARVGKFVSCNGGAKKENTSVNSKQTIVGMALGTFYCCVICFSFFVIEVFVSVF
jgi:hypothetical protein